jgi:hypothetical protein
LRLGEDGDGCNRDEGGKAECGDYDEAA